MATIIQSDGIVLSDTRENNLQEKNPQVKNVIGEIVIKAISNHIDDVVFDIGGGFLRDGGLEKDGGEWAKRSDSDIDVVVRIPKQDELLLQKRGEAHSWAMKAVKSNQNGHHDEAVHAQEEYQRAYQEISKFNNGNIKEFRTAIDSLFADLEKEGIVITNRRDITKDDMYHISLYRADLVRDGVTVQLDLCYRPTYYLDFDVNAPKWNSDDGMFLPYDILSIDDIKKNIASRSFNVMWLPTWGHSEFNRILGRKKAMEARGWTCLNFEKVKSHRLYRVYCDNNYDSDKSS